MSSAGMRVIVLGLIVSLTFPFASGCCTIAGGLLGGGAGGIVGGGVGLLCGKPKEGAESGASTGAAIGGGAGLVCDAVVLSPFIIAACASNHDKSPEALSAKDVEKLCESGVEDQVIITQIEQVGMKGPLSVEEIARLQEQGVSSAVIQIAQQHPAPIEPPQSAPTDSPDVNTSEAPQFATSGVAQASDTASSVSAPLPSSPSTPAEIAPMFESAPYTQSYAQPGAPPSGSSNLP